MSPRPFHRWLILIFAISGFSGLIYESLWTHYLKLFLGHASYAQVLVLMIFMGGMAAGAKLVGNRSQSWRHPLLVYALLEGVIGVVGLLFHSLYVNTTGFYFDTLSPLLGDTGMAVAARWGLGVLLVLPQSILLGMTFPLMAAGLIRQVPERNGGLLASLYFSNSLGAAVGVLANGFWLIPTVGLPGATMTAGLLNIIVALLVWIPASGQNPGVPRVGQRILLGTHVSWQWVLPAVALVTGFSSFLYEIGWIRMLNLVLGSSSHAFEIMLSSFLLGLALGGWWIKNRIDQWSDSLWALGVVQLAMGVFAVATVPIYNNTFFWMAKILASFSRSEEGYIGFLTASHLLTLVFMLPATLCAGMTLPLLTKILMDKGGGERAVGQIYAANTLGAILGVMAAVWLLLPVVGVKGVVGVGAALDVALGCLLLFVHGRHRATTWDRLMVVAAMGFVAVILLTVELDPRRMAAGVFRSGAAIWSQEAQIPYHRDGRSATVSLVVTPDHHTGIFTNGKPDAVISLSTQSTTDDEITMTLAGALPLVLHPTAVTGAVIGMGSGMTSSVLLATPQLTSLDTIEIEPLMIEAAQQGFGEYLGHWEKDPRSHIYVEDAKNFFATTGNRYDIIVSEPSNPWVSGVSSLFTQEFYSVLHRHLNPGGVLVQWVHAYESDISVIASIIKALSPQFQDWHLYLTNDLDLLLVARKGMALPAPDAQVLGQRQLATLLKRVGIQGTQDLARHYVGDKGLLDNFFQRWPVPANSDYFPYVDVHALRGLFLKNHVTEFTRWLTLGQPVLEMLGHRPPGNRTALPSVPFFLAHDQLVTQAIHLRDFNTEALSLPVRSHLLWATLTDPSCLRGVDHDLWRNGLVETAHRVTALLTPAELNLFWNRLISPECQEKLATEDRQLLALFQAVGQRDGLNMARLAETLLDTPLRASMEDYLVITALLGHITAKDGQAAERVFQRYIASSKTPPSTLVSLLLSQIE